MPQSLKLPYASSPPLCIAVGSRLTVQPAWPSHHGVSIAPKYIDRRLWAGVLSFSSSMHGLIDREAIERVRSYTHINFAARN